MTIPLTSVLLPRVPVLHPAMPRSQGRCLIGGTLGLLAFLFVGLLPAVLVGGTMGIQLANVVFGAEGAPTLGVSAITIGGVMLATTAGAALFAALGAALAAAIGELNGPRAARVRAP